MRHPQHWLALSSVAACFVICARSTDAFISSSSSPPPPPHPRQIVATVSLFSSSGSSGSGSGSGIDTNPSVDDPYSMPPIDLRLFLTQCSVQSFMFLLSQCRDMYTIRWLDNFTSPILPSVGEVELKFDDGTSIAVSPFTPGGTMKESSQLLQYHGLNAFNTTLFPTWDAFFRSLLNEPAEILEIVSNNPGTPFQAFEIDIEPGRLCSRILSVRQQIAQEWVHDLDVLAKMGRQVFESYWENAKQGGDVSKKQGFDREGLWFLDYVNSKDTDLAPSPLRKGNFDLLKLLATEESVRRVLSRGIAFPAEDADASGTNNGKDDDDAASKRNNAIASLEFLQKFYVERIPTHFRGYVKYGRADDFIEELMLIPPRIVTMTGVDDGAVGLVDPVRLAEVVMEERECVALDWKDLSSQFPSEHVEIQKLQLDKMMGL